VEEVKVFQENILCIAEAFYF